MRVSIKAAAARTARTMAEATQKVFRAFLRRLIFLRRGFKFLINSKMVLALKIQCHYSDLVHCLKLYFFGAV